MINSTKSFFTRLILVFLLPAQALNAQGQSKFMLDQGALHKIRQLTFKSRDYTQRRTMTGFEIPVAIVAAKFVAAGITGLVGFFIAKDLIIEGVKQIAINQIRCSDKIRHRLSFGRRL